MDCRLEVVGRCAFAVWPELTKPDGPMCAGQRAPDRRLDGVGERVTSRRWFITRLAAISLLSPHLVGAQAPGRLRHVAWVSLGAIEGTHQEALRSTLRELGWTEGQSVAFEWMSAGGSTAKFSELARELVARKPDVIVTSGTTSIRIVSEMTSTIPIVMAAGGDPVGAGLIKSLRRPGGNITGVSVVGQELIWKNLELFKHIVPALRIVTVIRAAANPANPFFLAQAEAAGTRLGLRVNAADVRDSDDIGNTFRRHAIEAAFMLLDPLFFVHRRRLAEAAIRHKVPLTASGSEYAAAGFLFTYGADYRGVVRLAATFVDRILRGANPAELPVEQPTKFELVINLKTAKALGLTIPPSLLLRADQVIE